MELWKAFKKRRTIRKFSGPPSDKQLERVLDAGSLAPSAGNKQAWFVVVVNDPETREKLGEIKKSYNASWTPDTEEGRARLEAQKNVFKDCTSLVFYTFAPEPDDPHSADMGSVWLLIENLCLAAEAEGLGTQICGIAGVWAEEVNKLLGVPAKYRLVAGVNVGVPDPGYKVPEKSLKPKSEWI
ncbi:MAG: nitroreductase family protein, partial [Spirochaetales bacterium]|nr:nitroreductase family protein [Spirochaetales bacterium]